MKKNIKAILSVLLVLVMVFSFAGCGDSGEKPAESTADMTDDFFTDTESVIGNDASSKTDTTQSDGEQSIPEDNKVGGKSWAEVLAAMPKSLRGTTITMYNWNAAGEYSGAPAVIQQFEKDTGIKINWMTVNYDDYYSKLTSLIASGEAPDVVRTLTPNAQGLKTFQPISVTGYDFSDEAWDQTLMKDYSVNGKIYATSLKNTHIGSVRMLHYNKALIEKYDLEDPYQLWKNGKWTWEKFLDICKDFVSESKAEFAVGGRGWEVWTEMFGVRGPIGYDGSKYYSAIGDSNFITVTQEIADLYNTSKLFKQWSSDEFNQGECLFWGGASVFARRNNAYFGNLKSAGTLYSVPLPAVEGQSTYYQGRDEYEAYAISSGAKNPQAVPYFLRYFLDAANYNMSSFFCNSQTLEVYNWCMSQENNIWATYYSSMSFFGADANDKFSEIEQLKGNQIKSFVDSNASVINSRVKRLNEALEKVK